MGKPKRPITGRFLLIGEFPPRIIFKRGAFYKRRKKIIRYSVEAPLLFGLIKYKTKCGFKSFRVQTRLKFFKKSVFCKYFGAGSPKRVADKNIRNAAAQKR